MQAWEEFLLHQEKELGKITVDKWLRSLQLVKFDACNIYLEASNSFAISWFEEHMRSRVQKALYNNNHKPIKVHIEVPTSSCVNEQVPATFSLQEIAPSSISLDEVDPEATFAHFIPSPSNLLAYKLFTAIFSNYLNLGNSLNPNPIYLYGKEGTGKTHLLQAAATQMRMNGKNALYVRAETFTEHVVDAIRKGDMQSFRKLYRNADALFIDNIEVFSRKSATQEELFHTFNHLHIKNKPIVLASCPPPKELLFIEPRLISRFEWGIVIPLSPLPLQDQEKMLLEKSWRRGFSLSNEIIMFLLQTFSTNTHSLLRGVEALLLRCHLEQTTGSVSSLSVEEVKMLLPDLILEEEKPLLSPNKIIHTVAQYYGVRIIDILSRSQRRKCALPRQIAMHLCRDKLHLPYMKIGDIFARNHSTVMTAIKQIQKALLTKEGQIESSVKEVLKLLDSQIELPI